MPAMEAGLRFQLSRQGGPSIGTRCRIFSDDTEIKRSNRAWMYDNDGRNMTIVNQASWPGAIAPWLNGKAAYSGSAIEQISAIVPTNRLELCPAYKIISFTFPTHTTALGRLC